VNPTADRAQLDAYLRDLGRRLPGPRRRRQRILAELRHGLDQAVADRTAAGVGERTAVSAAIAEFGPPQAVADAFTDELATAHARRVLAWFLATGPLVGVSWLLLLQPHPWRSGLVALLAAIPVLPMVALAVAAATSTLATTGRLMRWLPEVDPRRALVATIAVTGLVLAVDVMLIAIYARSDLPREPLAAVAVVGSLVRAGCSIVALRRAVAMRRIVLRRAAMHGRSAFDE
jgi:hypothetical protein